MINASGTRNASYKKTPKKRSISDISGTRVDEQNRGGLLGGIGYLGGSLIAGIGGVGEGIADLFTAAGAAIRGDFEYAKYVFKDNNVGEWHESITESYNPGNVMKFFGDVTHGIGQSSVFLLNAIPGLGQLGTAAFFAGTASQGISSAAAKTGDVGFGEVTYGLLSGGVEAGLEAAFGGMGKVAKNVGSSLSKNIAKTATRKGLVKSILTDAASEFGEEFASELIDPWLLNWTQVDPDARMSLGDAVYAGFVGLVSGTVSAGVSDVAKFAGNRKNGAKIMQAGNADTLINTANYVADKMIGQGADFKKAPEWAQHLRAQVNAYNDLVKKGKATGATAETILGEIQASLYFAETQSMHERIKADIMAKSEEDRAALAEYVNQTVEKAKRKKDYTAADVAADTDGIASQLATMSFVRGGFDIDGAIEDLQQEGGIENVINSERAEAAKRAEAEKKKEQGAETDAAFEAAAARGEASPIVETPQPSAAQGAVDGGVPIAGETAFVQNDEVVAPNRAAPVENIYEEGAESLPYGGVPEARVGTYPSVEEPDTEGRKIKYALAEYDEGVLPDARDLEPAGISPKTAVQAEIDEMTVTEADRAAARERTEKAANFEREQAEAYIGGVVSESRERATEGKDEAQRAESGAEDIKINEPREALTDEQRAEKAGKAAKAKAQEWVEWDKKTAPTMRELNRARELVKEFDELEIPRRLAILRTIRSAEGVDAVTLKGVVNIMSVLPKSDLEIRFAEGIGQKGLYTTVGGKKLIVLNSDTNFKATIKGTIAHELVHYLEKRAGYKEFAEFVRKNAKPEAIERHKQRYIDGWAALGYEYTEAELEEEITASLVADALQSERFLKRYADRDKKLIQRAASWLGGLVKGLKRKGKETREERKIAEAYGTMMSALLQMPEVGKSESGRKYSFAGEKAETADKLKLETAKAMLESGADSETVRRETGWFKGYDGKWRFEIDDFESGLIEKPKLERHEDDGEVYYTGKLTDIFDHKELFKAYPELKDINIVIQKTEFGVDAIYQPGFNYITLSREHFKRYTKAYNEYLNGGRKTEIEQIEQTPEFKEYNKWYDDEIADNMDPTEWLAGELAARNKFFSSELGKRYHRLKYSKDGFTGEKFELGWDKGAKEVILHELQHAIQKIEGFASGTNTRDKNYDRSAGEIEAFDTGRRANLTEEQRKNTRPDIDREDVVFAEGSVNYYAANDKSAENESTKEQLRNHLDEVNKMEPVANVKYHVINKEKAKQDAKDFYKSKGYKVDRQNFGIIEMGEGEVELSSNYANTAAEFAAWMTIPNVLKRGRLISGHKDHKGEGFPTYTFAAPVVINEKKGVVAVVVRKTGKYRYKMHRILMPDGSIFAYKDINENAELTGSDILLDQEEKGPDISSASTNSIPQKNDLSTPAVKKYDLADDGKKTEKEEKRDVYFENAELRGEKRSLTRRLEASKAEAARYRAEGMSLAKRIAQDAYETDAKTFTQKEVEELIERINVYSTEKFKDIMNEKSATLSKADKEQFAFDIYVAFHVASADSHAIERIRVLADKLAREYLGNVYYSEDGSRLYLNEIVDEATYEEYVKTFTNKIMASFKSMGRETTHARLTAKYRAEMAMLQKKLLDSESKGKNLRELQYQAKQLRTTVDIQKRSPQDEGIYNVEREMSRIADERGRVNAKQADKAFDQMHLFLTSDSGKVDSALEELAQVEGESMIELIEEYKHSREQSQSKYLSSEEMALAAKIIAGGRKILREYNRVFYNGHWEDMGKLASDEVIDLLSFSGAKKEYKTKIGEFFGEKIGKGIQQAYFYNILSPETVIEALEGYKKNGILKTLYHTVREATQKSEHMAVKMKKPFAEFLDDKENVWEDEKGHKHTFRDKLNEKIVVVNGTELTLGEAIYLYMLTKREHSHLGLKEGGFVTYDENNQSKRDVGLKIEDPGAAAGQIDSQLDATDKAFLKMAETFFNETASKIKYDADMKILGYTNNQEGYYVPIIRDRYARMANVTDKRQSIGSIATVYNKSFTKQTIENAKALEGKNIMEIINDHADGLADYSELYLPLKSFDRIYNTRVITDTAQSTSIRKVLNNKVWRGSDKYFKKLFADIQGQGEERGTIDTLVGKLRAGWVNSVLGLNLKVVATQTTSFVAANQVIEMKYLAPALAKFVGNQSELGARADEYSDIIEARNFEMGALRAQGNIDKVAKWAEKSGFMINWMDRRVCLAIFHAAELKAEAQGAGAVGTVENAQAAAKIADEVIYTTQAMTSRAERSALQRSKSEIGKMFAMFTSDSVKQLSHFYGNTMKYLAHRERAKTDATYEAELKKDARAMGRSAVTLISTGIMLGLITQAFKYLYAKEEEDPEEKQKDFAIDMISSTLNILPIVSDVADKFVFGYDLSLNVLDIANDTIEDTRDLFSMLGKSMSGEYVSNGDVWQSVINTVKSYATMFGVPLEPLERTAAGLLRRFTPSTIYGYDALFSNPSYTADLKKAVESGDERLAEHILATLYDNEITGVYSSEELEEIARLYSITDDEGKHLSVLPQRIGDTVNDVKLDAKQRKRFAAIYSEASAEVNRLIDSPYYDALDDAQKAKAIKNTYSLYYNRAASEVVGKEWTNAQAYSLLTSDIPALFATQAYRSGLEAQKDERGKEISVKDQFVEYAANLGLSDADLTVISYANSVRGKEMKTKLIDHINSLSLDEETKAKIAERLGFVIKNGKVAEKED